MKKKLFIFLLCGFLALSLSGCGNNSSDSTSQGESTSAEDLEKNISVAEEGITESNLLVIVVSNDNDESVYVEVEAVFYDEDGNALNSETTYMSIYSNSEMACYFYNTPSDFDTYEINFDADNSYYEDYSDQVEITDNDTGSQVTVQATNNSSETIESIDVAVVFYRDGTIVGFDEDFSYDLDAGKTDTFNIYYPFDENYENVEYDEYKVYFSAYNFTV